MGRGTGPASEEAQQHLESVLAYLETRFAPSPAGVGITIAWGLPYFRHFIPCLGKESGFFKAGTRFPAYLPVDVATSKAKGKTVYALQDGRTFPSGQPPPGFGPVRLEDNDVAVFLRSDSLAHITSATRAIFGSGRGQAGSLFKVTSIRQGFAGGGFYGQQGLPSKLALAAGIPGAASIPRHHPRAGVRDLRTPAAGPDLGQVAEDVQRYHSYGHSGSLSVVDSTASQITSYYGEKYPAGTTIPLRGDFNTLDNPFYYTSDPRADHFSPKPAAGLHFLMFQPTIEIFNNIRLAMDGHFPDRTLPVSPRLADFRADHTGHRGTHARGGERHRGDVRRGAGGTEDHELGSREPPRVRQHRGTLRGADGDDDLAPPDEQRPKERQRVRLRRRTRHRQV